MSHMKLVQHPIHQSHIMNQGLAEEFVGRRLPSRAFQWAPQGSRILIAKDSVPDKVGSILITENQQALESMGTGYIIGVGHMAGMTIQDPRMGNIQANESAEDLMQLHVMFGFAAGKAVRFTIFDSDYASECVLMTPLDIWMVDLAADPAAADLAADEEFFEQQAEARDAAISDEQSAALAIQAERDKFVKGLEDAGHPVPDGAIIVRG